MLTLQCKITCDCACPNSLTLQIVDTDVDQIKLRARRLGWDFGDAPNIDCPAFCPDHASAAKRIQEVVP